MTTYIIINNHYITKIQLHSILHLLQQCQPFLIVCLILLGNSSHSAELPVQSVPRHIKFTKQMSKVLSASTELQLDVQISASAEEHSDTECLADMLTVQVSLFLSLCSGLV